MADNENDSTPEFETLPGPVGDCLRALAKREGVGKEEVIRLILGERRSEDPGPNGNQG